MSSGKSVSKDHGLHLNVNRRVRNDSRCYLLQPEMSTGSPTSTQFNLSPTYSFTGDTCNSVHRNTYMPMQNDIIQNCSGGSLVPLIQNCQPHALLGYRPTDASMNYSNSSYGVGDLEQVHIDGMNNRPNTKMYDYADYGHQYEELPGGRKSIAKCRMDSGIDSRSEYQSSGGATDIVSDAEDANIIRNGNDKRKRVNPLYDGMTQSMPSIYNKTKDTKDEDLRKQVQYLRCALVVLVIISCAALAVSVFAVISMSKDDKQAHLSLQVERLKQDYSQMETLLTTFDDNNNTMKVLADLIHKVSALEQNTSRQIGMLHLQVGNAESDIHKSAEDLMSTHSNLSDIISQLNTTIQLQLYNISKQEGPRGPQGVANFSRCSYFNVSNFAVASGSYPSWTPWAPTETDLQDNVAIFAGCSVDGGTSHMLETHAIRKDSVQYRCQCSGRADKDTRICYVHIFSCPRNS